MTALEEFQCKIGNTMQGGGGDYLIESVISACTNTKINLNAASYKLDYSNKILLIELIKSMLFGEDEIWNDVEILEWIEENQPYIYKKEMNN